MIIIKRQEQDNYSSSESPFYSYNADISDDDGGLPQIYISLAGVCAIAASIITFITIFLHLKNYKRPDLQRSTIRILLMTPIYAIISWIALMSKEAADYLDVIRDVYEAFVVYVFFCFLVNLMDGERALLRKLRNRRPTPQHFPFSLFLPPLKIGDSMQFLNIKRGILQFTLLKPFLALFIFMLKLLNVYHEGYIAWDSPYMYIVILYNLSVCMAMYYLLMFFLTIKDDVKEHEPTSKLLCVKSVVFFSFWQGVVISILVFFDVLKGSGTYSAMNIATAIQDFSICIEMFLVSFAHIFAFGYHYYEELSSARLPLRYALRDAFGIQDVFQDSYYTILGEDEAEYLTKRAPAQSTDDDASPPNENSSLIPRRGSAGKVSVRKANILDLFRSLILLFTKHGADSFRKLIFRERNSSRGGRIASPTQEPEIMMNASARYPTKGPLKQDTSVAEGSNSNQDHVTPASITFPDIDPNSTIEKLYLESRRLLHGDYNYPVISSPLRLASVENPFHKSAQKKKARRPGTDSDDDDDEDVDTSPKRPMDIDTLVSKKIKQQGSKNSYQAR